MRKRAFSLVEMIISLGLFSLLLGTLFFWYHSLSKQKGEQNKLKGPLMEERYAFQRLQHILGKTDPYLFSALDDSSVTFIFDRGPAPTPEFSGPVLGRLYHDPENKWLCLGVWPHPKSGKNEPCETTLLLDGVAKCSFEFYSPPDPFKKIVDPEEIGKPRPIEGWQSQWSSTYNRLPALVKMKIARDESKGIEKHEFEFLFDLPSPLIYPMVSP